MSNNIQQQKAFKNLLKNSHYISEQEEISMDNELIFVDIVSKTSTFSLSHSPYLRLVELLHLFSTNLHDFFEEYLLTYYSDDEANIDIAEVKKRFVHDTIRYNTNHKAIEKYYDAFLYYLDTRPSIRYAPLIDSYMHELEQKVISSDNSIIFDYDCYKNFFRQFLSKMNFFLNIENEADPLYFLITDFRLSEINISILRKDFIADLHNDYQKNTYPELFSTSNDVIKNSLVTSIRNYCAYKPTKTKNDTTLSFLDIFASFRENWGIIQNLANNKTLSNYFFDFIRNSPIEKTEKLSNLKTLLEKENSLIIIERCTAYAYLLNYVPIQHTRVKAETIVSFFQAKCDSELNIVLFCINNIIYLSCMDETNLKYLFYYACTLEN